MCFHLVWLLSSLRKDKSRNVKKFRGTLSCYLIFHESPVWTGISVVQEPVCVTYEHSSLGAPREAWYARRVTWGEVLAAVGGN